MSELEREIWVKNTTYFKRTSLPLVLSALLTSCSHDPKIEGRRELFIAPPVEVSVAVSAQKKPMALQPVPNTQWLQDHMTSTHTLVAPAFDAKNCKELWHARFGKGSKRHERIIANLVAKDHIIYGADASGSIIAFDTKTQSVLWSIPLAKDNEDIAKIGGLAFLPDGRLVVTTSDGFLVLINCAKHTVEKKYDLRAPVRSAPCVVGSSILVQTSNNALAKFNSSLEPQWSLEETPENVVFFGNATPAADARTVVAAFSDGEYKAYDLASGNELWNDFLIAPNQDDTVANMLHICAAPIMSHDTVIVLGNGGKIIANDLTSGEHLWSLPFSGLRTPAVSGDWIFLIDANTLAVCIEKRSGKVRWHCSILPENLTSTVKSWTAPILAGNAMVCALDEGTLVFLDTSDGHVIQTLSSKMHNPVTSIVVDKVLYVLSQNGKIHAFG